MGKDAPDCDDIRSEPLICITRFSSAEDDDFSYALVSDLAERTAGLDSLQIQAVDTFLNPNIYSSIKSLEGLISNQCHKQGLVVFGRFSSETDLFDCSIYVSELLETQYTKSRLANNNLVRLKDPDMISFSIQKQSRVVSDFILMLLYYSQNRTAESIELIQKSITTDGALMSPSLQQLMLVYLGNAFADEGKLEESLSSYQTLLEVDSLSPLVNYNYGILCLDKGDSTLAAKHLNRASVTNPKFDNPLKDWKPSEEVQPSALPVNEVMKKPEVIDTVAKEPTNMSAQKRVTPQNAVVVNDSKPLKEDQLPKNCIIQKVGESKYALYNRDFQKVGLYEKVWKVQQPEITKLESRLKARFYYVQRDGYFGIIDDDGVVIVKPAAESLNQLNKLFLEALGQ
jgi:tetratricopeptide (TPR) repeat protein